MLLRYESIGSQNSMSDGSFSVERRESHKRNLTEDEIKEFLTLAENILRAKQPGGIFLAEEYISTDGTKTNQEIRSKLFADTISHDAVHRAFHESLPGGSKQTTEITGKVIKGNMKDLKDLLKLIEKGEDDDIDDIADKNK